MGALFEFLADVIVAVAVSALAQLGVDGARSAPQQSPPSVERTTLHTERSRPAETAGLPEDCDETAAYHAA
jgi:hypothetical protein